MLPLMASQDELARLRAEVRKGQRQVRAKMRYAAKHNRVEWDIKHNLAKVPLADFKKVDRYTEKQLKAFIDKQNKFLSRTNVLVGDSHRRLLPPEDVRENRRLEHLWVKKAKEYWGQFKDLPMSFLDGFQRQTLDTVREIRTPSVGLGSSSNFTVARPHNSFSGVANAGKLKAINEALKEKLEPDYFDKLNQRNLESAATMLSAYGVKGDRYTDKLVNLSDRELAIMFADRRFWDALKANYQRWRSGYEEGSEKEKQILRDFNVMDELFDWVPGAAKVQIANENKAARKLAAEKAAKKAIRASRIG